MNGGCFSGNTSVPIVYLVLSLVDCSGILVFVRALRFLNAPMKHVHIVIVIISIIAR